MAEHNEERVCFSKGLVYLVVIVFIVVLGILVVKSNQTYKSSAATPVCKESTVKCRYGGGLLAYNTCSPDATWICGCNNPESTTEFPHLLRITNRATQCAVTVVDCNDAAVVDTIAEANKTQGWCRYYNGGVIAGREYQNSITRCSTTYSTDASVCDTYTVGDPIGAAAGPPQCGNLACSYGTGTTAATTVTVGACVPNTKWICHCVDIASFTEKPRLVSSAACAAALAVACNTLSCTDFTDEANSSVAYGICTADGTRKCVCTDPASKKVKPYLKYDSTCASMPCSAKRCTDGEDAGICAVKLANSGKKCDCVDSNSTTEKPVYYDDTTCP